MQYTLSSSFLFRDNLTSSLRMLRKALRVFPDPVGLAIRVFFPAWMFAIANF